MASTYTTRLKLERQASGENSGNWGNLTNYVLNRIDSTVRGYVTLSVAGSANVTLVSNTSTTNTAEAADDQVHNKVIEFTGALTGAITVFTDAVEGDYTLFNNTTGSHVLKFANTGHASNGVAITQGQKALVYTTGTTVVDILAGAGLGNVSTTGTQTLTNKTLTSPKINENVVLASTATELNKLDALSRGSIIYGNASAATAVLTKGGAGTVLTSDGTDISWADASAGISWVTTPKTANFTVTAGEGYFMNSGSALTVSLPAGQAGATFAIADYARNFATNNLTISPNGSEKIGGIAEDATLNVDGQAATFVYVDGTKGWINVQNAEDTETGTPPFIQATGGTITQSGNFRIHTFNSPGTFQVTKIATESPAPIYNIVSYAVSAGGGGSGGSINNIHTAGGGGGGGYRGGRNQPVDSYTESPLCASSGLAVSAQSYSIVVGAGGAGGCGVTRGTNGVNSVFQSITSAGGGGGGAIGSPGAPACRSGRPGGSGGGGSSQTAANGGTGNTPPVSPAQGSNGGAGTDAPPDLRGGGGGGATATGGTGSPAAIQGRGGAGATTTISGSSLGYSGGGSAGGTGGGGPGAGAAASPCGSGAAGQPKCSPFDGNNATDNRGGGGGGSAANPSAPGSPGNFPGGNGGSGVVIIRYRFQ